MKIVCYVPSYNDSDAVRLSVESAGELPCVVSDNASEPEHALHLSRLADERDGRVTLVRQPRNLGRLGNWDFCVRHFLQSDAKWLKWLFAGDVLVSNARETLERTITAYPAARMIAGAFVLVERGQRTTWRQYVETRLLEPREAMRRAAEGGNWFGPPIAYCVHREALERGFDFGGLAWAGDFCFAVDVASRYPTVHLAESTGEFHADRRNFFNQQENRTEALLEEAVVRLRAARHYARLNGDTRDGQRFVRRIERLVEGRLLVLSAVRCGPFHVPRGVADFVFGTLGRRGWSAVADIARTRRAK